MAKNQLTGSTVMTPAERRRIAEEQKKRQKERTAKKNARIRASEFANLGSATGMQKETNKARNEGRYANVRFNKGDADPKGLFKPKPKPKPKPKAKTKSNVDAMAAAAKAKRDITAKVTAAEKKQSKTPSTKSRDKDGLGTKAKSPAKKYNVGVSKGGVSFGEAFKYYRGQGNKTFTWNGKKYTTDVKKAAPKAKVSTPTPADFSTSAKKDTKSKDLRGNQIKATPGKKGPLASARKEYPVTGPGSQSKVLRPKKPAAKIPAGAKRLTSKGYDSKKFKLQNINGETYVVPKGK
jgi:hypothetical protein